MKGYRVLVLGLDGLDPRFALQAAGRLPGIKRLVERGFCCRMRSVYPPVTIPAWVSLATGLSPQKLGAVDFLRRVRGGYRLTSVGSELYRGRAYWDWLSAMGKSAGVAFYPFLYPPYPVRGFMVATLGPAQRLEDIVWPSELVDLLGGPGEVRLFVPYMNKRYEDVELFLSEVREVLSRQLEMAEKLLVEYFERRGVDSWTYVCTFPDALFHRLGTELASYPEGAVEVLEAVDVFLQRLEELADAEGAALLVVSDHGHGPNTGVFNLARWLVERGYMRRSARGAAASAVKASLSRALRLASRALAAAGLEGGARLVRGLSARLTTSLADEIDFSRSVAYCLGHTIPFGGIYVNVRGRDPQGTVDPSEYEGVVATIVRDLRDYCSRLGVKLDYVLNPLHPVLPDIVFSLDGFAVVVTESGFSPPTFRRGPFCSRHVSSHRVEGVFMAYGSAFRRSDSPFSGVVDMLDVMPLIAHLSGLPVPPWAEGRVPVECLSGEAAGVLGEPRKANWREAVRARVRLLRNLGRSAQLIKREG